MKYIKSNWFLRDFVFQTGGGRVHNARMKLEWTKRDGKPENTHHVVKYSRRLNGEIGAQQWKVSIWIVKTMKGEKWKQWKVHTWIVKTARSRKANNSKDGVSGISSRCARGKVTRRSETSARDKVLSILTMWQKLQEQFLSCRKQQNLNPFKTILK